MSQLHLAFRSHGGWRPGAGRKPGPTSGVPHRRRAPHDARTPVHVTLRAAKGLPSLRTCRVIPVVRGALGAGSTHAFRIAHFSVQSNHLHLIVEADHGRALSRGLQGLAIRLAKAVNRLLRRHGTVWAGRYHARALRTPREVRNGLVYVLLNGRKHGAHHRGVDPCSSGAWFSGWRETIRAVAGCAPVVRARTWLLGVGWRRWGPISVRETPRAGSLGRSRRKRVRPVP
jgi:hypothetical protein